MDIVPVASAFVLGALHTFETDHLTAVSAFVARRPGPAAAVGYGVRWAAGHGGIVLIAGITLLLAGVTIPDAAGVWLERLVGASLVALGAWVLASAARTREHGHAHDHHEEGADHAHAATAMGALHGLAGSAPVVALLPLARGSSLLEGSVFLIAFGVGTALAMATYALIAGAAVQRAAHRWDAFAWRFSACAGVGTMAVGAWWMAGGAG